MQPSLWDDAAPFRSNISHGTVGKEIRIIGYIVTRRDVNKNLSFTTLRNPRQSAAIQLVSSANVDGSDEANAHARLRTLREWTPVMITGTVQQRTPAKPVKPADGSTDESHNGSTTMVESRELLLKSIVPLNEIDKDVIVKEEAVYGPEQRYLQLRTTPSLVKNLKDRQRAMNVARNYLNKNEWTEIETPLLFKSTPEGAREFLVPSRNKGLAYALPQSPQQYKQILMASGIDKYFQFARCFRDEDLRADRQPEFTQVSVRDDGRDLC